MAQTDNETRQRRRMARVAGAILSDPGGAHSVDTLAGIAHLSPFHFHRLYHAHAGEPVVQTLRRVRLNQAAALLVTTDWAVSRIALEVGYDSAQAFSRAFGAALGMSPRALRMKLAGSYPMALPARRCFAPTEFLVDVELTTVPPQRLWALCHEGAVDAIAITARTLHMALQRAGRAQCLTVRVGVSVPDAAAPIGFRYQLGVFAAPDAPLADGLRLLTLPGGLYARHRLTGPYALINTAMRRLYAAWLPRSGYECDARPALELYLNSPLDTAERDLVTELLIPVRPVQP